MNVLMVRAALLESTGAEFLVRGKGIIVAALLCRSHSGKAQSVYKLQAFLELAVGDQRLKAAQELANTRITY